MDLKVGRRQLGCTRHIHTTNVKRYCFRNLPFRLTLAMTLGLVEIVSAQTSYLKLFAYKTPIVARTRASDYIKRDYKTLREEFSRALNPAEIDRTLWDGAVASDFPCPSDLANQLHDRAFESILFIS